jgi:hypothetical protein
MRIFKEKAGVISEGRCWICVSNGYLYIEDTLLKLLWVLITEWKHDKHLVG